MVYTCQYNWHPPKWYIQKTSYPRGSLSLLLRKLIETDQVVDLPIKGVLCKRPFTHEGNYLVGLFPCISLEIPEMCVETLPTGLVFLKGLIWGVTCLGFLEKWMFSHLSPWKSHKYVLKPSEQCSCFWDDRFEGSHAYVYSKNEYFPIYLLRNPINMCWNPQNSAHVSEMIDLRGHMPMFTWKKNVFPCISLETP